MKANELLNDALYALRKTDTIATAKAFMAEQGVTELPILDKLKLYNYVRAIMISEHSPDLLLKDVIPFNPHSARIMENAHLYEIVPAIAASDLQVVAVVNEKDEFVGIVDQKNIHKLISKSLTYKGMGAVIQVNIIPVDFAPSQIARLVEENGAKVLGMMTENNDDGTLSVSLKLNTTIVKNIIATFNRFNIRVTNCFMAEDYNIGTEKEFASALRFFDF